MKRMLLQMMLLVLPFAAWAQNACYLLGTDGDDPKANHASATLENTSEGVFKGEVTFRYGRFAIATELGTEEDMMQIEKFCYGPREQEWVLPGQVLNIGPWYEVGPMRFFEVAEMAMTGGGDAGGIKEGEPYTVTVDFNQMTLLITEPASDEPDDSGEEEADDGTTPAADLDLTQGFHLTLTLPEAGSLQQRLQNAMYQQDDYDLVDFLTLKGKFGGKDLAYLKEQKGYLSQLQYLDLSEVELVYDDEPYFSVTVSDKGGEDLAIGIVNYSTIIYTLSAENKDETGEGGSFDGTSTSAVTYARRNDLAFAFSDMKYLKQIKLPKTLKGLGDGILEGSEVLAKVTFPDAPTYIGNYAFVNETGDFFGGLRRTLKGVDLPSSVTKLGKDALRGVGFRTIDVSRITELGEGCLRETNIKEVSLHPDVKTIPAMMFSGCNRLETVTIPQSIAAVGAEAFKDCENLASLTFAGQVEAIGKEAFSGCKKLTSVSINAIEIGERAFASCNLTTVEIADGAKVIGTLAFDRNNKLASVTAPNTLEEIGSHAFNGWGEYGVGVYDTPYITNLPAEDGVKYIGSVAYLFMGGDNLNIKEGTLGVADDFLDNHNMGGDYQWGHSAAFSGWTAPATVTLPSTLRVLGAGFGNQRITTLSLPESLVKIGGISCENLRGSITIPASVKYFGGITGKITRVYYNAVDAEVEGSFPETLTRAIIGEGVKNIPFGLFWRCTNLARVQMPSTVEHIGASAFDQCSSLTTIDLPSGLKEIGENAFYGAGLSAVIAYMPAPAHLEHLFVESHTQIPLLKVPNGSLAAYQQDAWWAAQFQKIEQFDGASVAEAVEETTTVSVSQTVTDDTDLTGTLLGGVYVTLDTEDSGDGYNATEGCLVINSTVSDEQLAAATADDADDLTVKNQFNGLIFEVPAGRGSIVIDCQTLGQQAVCVKIGQNEPKQVDTNGRQQVSIPYEVGELTRIYVYAAPKSTAAARQSVADEPQSAPRRAAYANDDAVKLYGLAINVDENLAGISTPRGDRRGAVSVRKVVEHGRLYILLPDGRKYSAEGVQQ